MKVLLSFLLSLIATGWGMAQGIDQAISEEPLTLEERYTVMKEYSQTFKDYKVIKEYVLDGMWELVRDSLAAEKALLAESYKLSQSLEDELQATNNQLAQTKEEQAKVVFDSEHIAVAGVDFSKQAFLMTVFGIISGLLASIFIILGRQKILARTLGEKSDVLNIVSHEFEEYKRNALDRQMKLSRELQDERNKVHSFRSV